MKEGDTVTAGQLLAVIEPDTANGLRIRSQIMTDKLFAQRRERVREVIGAIDDETGRRLDTALLVVLGLAQ